MFLQSSPHWPSCVVPQPTQVVEQTDWVVVCLVSGAVKIMPTLRHFPSAMQELCIGMVMHKKGIVQAGICQGCEISCFSTHIVLIGLDWPPPNPCFVRRG
ncbi:hypothetical protein HZ326_27881 [Fusarium oxysporum f. sp. albedinis]|nr:hypothetical protein HZ326_27881 [Fusarium oxysporum f. sp. albedinis]